MPKKSVLCSWTAARTPTSRLATARGAAELALQENRSCAEHMAMLEAEGFRVTRDVAGIPTAVTGEAGEGGR